MFRRTQEDLGVRRIIRLLLYDRILRVTRNSDELVEANIDALNYDIIDQAGGG